MSGRAQLKHSQDAAVIDVGSNSVRLVIYRIDGRAMTPILNEKVMAGLGRGLQKHGFLAESGVEAAMRALKRFSAMVEALGVRDVFPVATAAVRQARDGRAFAERVKDETGFGLRILSGADEARLSALGVSAGAPDAHGVVGDLGGASLELIPMNTRGLGAGETFSLGPLALAREEDFEYQRVSKQVSETLAGAKALKRKGGDFYAVGGAWRALGRIDMGFRNHPLGVLHHYEMSRADVLKLVDVVRKQSKRSLERMEDAAAKRAESLPYAAVVLERVMLAGQFDRVILSAFGLREGVLVERMSEAALAAHPLIAAAEAFSGRWALARNFGVALEQWIAPMFAHQPAVFSANHDRVLRGAAARLADLGGPLHPDQRAEVMFDLILRAPLAAISHEERAYLAASIHHRYAKQPPRHAPAYVRLLSDERRAAAAALGAALRSGPTFPGAARALAAFDIAAVDGRLELREEEIGTLGHRNCAAPASVAAAALGSPRR